MKKMFAVIIMLCVALTCYALDKGESVVMWIPRPAYDSHPEQQPITEGQVQAYYALTLPTGTNTVLAHAKYYKGNTNGLLSCLNWQQVKPELIAEVVYTLKTNAMAKYESNEIEAEIMQSSNIKSFLQGKGITAGELP